MWLYFCTLPYNGKQGPFVNVMRSPTRLISHKVVCTASLIAALEHCGFSRFWVAWVFSLATSTQNEICIRLCKLLLEKGTARVNVRGQSGDLVTHRNDSRKTIGLSAFTIFPFSSPSVKSYLHIVTLLSCLFTSPCLICVYRYIYLYMSMKEIHPKRYVNIGKNNQFNSCRLFLWIIRL